MNITLSSTHPPSSVYSLYPSSLMYLSFSLSHLICMFTRWRDFYPSGEIICPRLSLCMQDIRRRGESSLPVSPQLNTKKTNKKTRNLDVGCSAAAVITIWKQCVVSTELVVLVAGFSVDIWLMIWWNFCPSPSLCDSQRALFTPMTVCQTPARLPQVSRLRWSNQCRPPHR